LFEQAGLMWEFFRRNGTLATSGALLALSLALVSANARRHRMDDPASRALLEGLRPLQLAITETARLIAGAWRKYIALVGLQRENEALRKRLLELEQEIVRLAEVEQTNRRLSELLRFRSTFGGRAVAAQVIAKDPLPWFRSFVIDKGEADGVRKGMAVLSAQGVVGQVQQAGRHSARVLLITDHNSGVDAVVQRSRARGIVEGAVGDGCVMKYLKPGEDVQIGDWVVTSGFDGIFPKGIVIGHVTGLSRRSRALLQVAQVEPAAPFDRLEEVLVVEPENSRER